MLWIIMFALILVILLVDCTHTSSILKNDAVINKWIYYSILLIDVKHKIILLQNSKCAIF